MNSLSSSAAAKQSAATHNLVLTGMFAAVLAVISQISIPLPTGVPVTIQVFGIALTGAVLGWKLGCLSTLVYIALGCVGLPVFANFRGGLPCLVGVSGGYILAWPVMAALSGIRLKHSSPLVSRTSSFFFAIAGLLFVELAGAFQWSLLTSEMSLGAILAYSLVAFIPKDVVITLLGVMVGQQIRKSITPLQATRH